MASNRAFLLSAVIVDSVPVQIQKRMPIHLAAHDSKAFAAGESEAVATLYCQGTFESVMNGHNKRSTISCVR